MFRKMRRIKQELTNDECVEILNKENCGVLALMDDEYPYSVPLSYVYKDNKIYFHSAKVGHKIDLIRKNPNASFCIVEKNDIVKEEYTTYFRSMILFGNVRILEDLNEIRDVMRNLSIKFYQEDSKENREEVIEKEIKFVSVIEFTIEHMSGKEAIELVKMRQ